MSSIAPLASKEIEKACRDKGVRMLDAPLPLTALVMEILQMLHSDGYGQMDHSAIPRYYEKLAGSEIG